jgi:Ca-activated chloride channel family protein
VRVHSTSDRTLIRADAESVRYVKVSFVAPPSPRRAGRWPVSVALVLDRSGSMAGRKIELARDAVMQAIRLLQPTDRFALVVYDNEIDVLAESGPATPEAKRRAFERLALVQARGSTDLCAGWLRGTDEIGRSLQRDTIGRCLLLTDGLANQGVTDRAELVLAAGALRTQGLSTSTFGVGEDFDERLLRGLAEASAGNFYFIERPEQIPDLLASELGETLEIVARDAVLEVTLGPGMSAESLNRSRHDRDANRVRVHLGHLVSNQEMEVVVKLVFPSARADAGTVEPGVAASFTVFDPAGAIAAVPHELRWTFADHEANDAQPRDRNVDVAVATLYAARARDEALERNREGDREGARKVLRATARRIRSYAATDRRLLAIAAQLEAEGEDYGYRALSAMELKQGVFADYVAYSSRAPSGKARRSRRP